MLHILKRFLFFIIVTFSVTLCLISCNNSNEKPTTELSDNTNNNITPAKPVSGVNKIERLIEDDNSISSDELNNNKPDSSPLYEEFTEGTGIDKPSEIKSYMAGGVSIKIPSPSPEFVDVGDEYRPILELFVPDTNRLLCGFILRTDMPQLIEGDEDLVLSRYSMVQVPRRGEYMDCSASDFAEVLEGAKQEFGDTSSLSFQEVEDEFNRRMKALDLDDLQMKMGETTQLGCLFSKEDVYSFGMVSVTSIGDESMKMGMACILLRARQRLLFIYLYAQYENEGTITWLRNTAEQWSDAILLANK